MTNDYSNLKGVSDAITQFHENLCGIGDLKSSLELILGKVSAEELLQMTAGINKIIEGFDVNNEGELFKETYKIQLWLVQEYLKNCIKVVGKEQVEKRFSSEEGKKEGFFYLSLIKCNLEELKDLKPEERKLFTDMLMKSVNIAYEMLQSSQVVKPSEIVVK